MKPPKVVVFDLGKVLVDFDYGIAARRIAARATMPANEVRDSIDHSPLLFQFETGSMTKDEFFGEIRRTTGFRGSLDEFCDYFADIFKPIELMVKLHAQLRAKGIPTFIFSNTNELAVGHIRNRFPFFSQFDGYILSYEHGWMKPDARLYEVVERTTGLRALDLMYLDDRKENIETATKRGWITVQHITPQKSWKAVQAAGMLD